MKKQLYSLNRELTIQINKYVNEIETFTQTYFSSDFYTNPTGEISQEFLKEQETMYDKMTETFDRCEYILHTSEKIKDLMREYQEIMDEMTTMCQIQKEEIGNKINSIVEHMEIQERGLKQKPFTQTYRKNNFTKAYVETEKYMKKQKQLEAFRSIRIESRTSHYRKKEEERLKTLMLSTVQCVQLEMWTRMKVGEILFDSTIDDYSVGSSIFEQKMLGRSDIVFLIEDNETNKFGYYLSTPVILKFGKWIATNKKSFLFSLENVNRPGQTMKCPIRDTRFGYGALWRTDKSLCILGNQIVLSRKNSGCHCVYEENQKYFNFKNTMNVLRQVGTFTLKRFLVIQMK